MLIDKPNKETLAWPDYVLFMLNELNVSAMLDII